MKNYLNQMFEKIFDQTNGIQYFSPARVNLIGEHIDYNGGFVFPCALSFGTYGIFKLRNDQNFRVYSEDFSKEIYTFNINDLVKDPANDWVDYVKGVIAAVIKRGHKITNGFDLFIKGNMPSGAGLSSSASLESLIVTILNDSFNLGLTLEEKALIGKETENNFIGVNSGIMDQFAVLAGKKDHAILLNTNTLAYELFPLSLNNYKLLIVNTNKKRGLADSKYNERFSECQEALSILKPIYNINYLCDLSPKKLDEIEKLLTPTVFKRVRHVITEQHRTIESTKVLKQNDILAFASLMSASHDSLKNDYDVTGVELDTLQSLLLEHGAIGARMTGAGFGGCCVAIVDERILDTLKLKVTEAYTMIIGYEPSFFDALPEEGTHKL